MNMKELEALAKSQAEAITQLQAEMRSVMEVTQKQHRELQAVHEQMSQATALTEGICDQVNALKTWIGADDSDGPFYDEFKALCAAVDDLRVKVEGRNKSAAVKRNMTDADAMRVLRDDLCELGHKEAAEELGLTYAQVYSCRLGFTFKHVIRELEKAGWKNRWAKGG